jgi:hypothetical protein
VVASPTTEAPWYSQTVESAKGLFLVTLESSEPDFVLNDFRDWHIVLQDKATGEGVTPARFVVGGGMPMHGHGLPSQPQVSEHLGEGRYLIEGIRFNMLGKWVFDIEVITQSGNDKVSFEVIVDY